MPNQNSYTLRSIGINIISGVAILLIAAGICWYFCPFTLEGSDNIQNQQGQRKDNIPTPNQNTNAQKVPGDKQPSVITNSLGMRFAQIPPGQFFMGSPVQESGRNDDEHQHRVKIDSFYLAVTEVTQQQYQEVMRNNPSFFSHGPSRALAAKKLPNTSRLPVESVTYDECLKFCKLLSNRPEELGHGRKYRLPTEAEWEYAARAGTNTPFHFGSELCVLDANILPNDGNKKFVNRPCETQNYRKNAFGLYDMHGNVAEWCADWYEAEYYQHSPQQNPKGPPFSSTNKRVVRGGAWLHSAIQNRVAFRMKRAPNDRADYIGFRVVLVLDKLNIQP